MKMTLPQTNTSQDTGTTDHVEIQPDTQEILAACQHMTMMICKSKKKCCKKYRKKGKSNCKSCPRVN